MLTFLKIKIESLIQTGHRSLRKSGEDLQMFLGISPSHTTIIKNWLTQEAENHIRNICISLFRLLYCYDEQLY